jgi:hypothetical protein
MIKILTISIITSLIEILINYLISKLSSKMLKEKTLLKNRSSKIILKN